MYFNSSNFNSPPKKAKQYCRPSYWQFSSFFLTREIPLMTKGALWVSNEYFNSHSVVFDGH